MTKDCFRYGWNVAKAKLLNVYVPEQNYWTTHRIVNVTNPTLSLLHAIKEHPSIIITET